jgi:hypothetical protein
MKRRRAVGRAATVCLVLGVLGQTDCANARSEFPETDATVANAVADAGADGLRFSVDSGDVASSCSVHCSSDMRRVIDCHDTVLKTCADTEGCTPGGECIPACDAAQVNKSAIGCDFYAVNPQPLDGETSGPCFVAFVANTWPQPVTLSVDYKGAALDVSTFGYVPSGSGTTVVYTPLVSGALDPGKVAVLFLAHNTAGRSGLCPKTPAVTTGASVYGSGRGSAFHITATLPVVSYDIFPFDNGITGSAIPSATLLLPTSAWDVNYLGVSPYKPSAAQNLDIVAVEDNTTIQINPTSNIAAGTGTNAATAGVVASYTLAKKGDLLQLATDGKFEFTGSVIQGDKPFGLWAATPALGVDVTTYAKDSAHQQLPPIRAFGSEYAAARYRNRRSVAETTPWRFVGAVDGTVLSYEPSTPVGAPTSLKSGELAEVWTADPFVVRSQDDAHPFYMSAHMTGCAKVSGCKGGDIGTGAVSDNGDPEFVNVIPTAQFLQSYVFFTDTSYKQTNLVFVRKRTTSGFKDVTLDCVGPLSGWAPLGSAGDYEVVRVDLVKDAVPQGKCDNGPHTAKSEAPFGLTVWGWSNVISYAYPAGAGVKAINSVVVPVIR